MQLIAFSLDFGVPCSRHDAEGIEAKDFKGMHGRKYKYML